MSGRLSGIWMLCAAALLCPLAARPTVKLMVPPPGRQAIEDLWKARVTSDSAYPEVWFEGFVSEVSRGQVFHATTRKFPLPKGIKVYQYRDVTIDKTETAAGYEAFVTRSGMLPAGFYRFRLILEPFGAADSYGFEVKPTGPPRLLTPLPGEALSTRYPFFSWTPSSPPPVPGFAYELVVAELLPGQTPQDAINANPAWFSRQGITATSLAYPVSGRKFVIGSSYAWQVNVRQGRLLLSSSEARSFAFGAERPMITREQAIAIIKAGAIKPDSSSQDLLAFLGREPLAPGDRVQEAFDSTETVISEPTWFGWLNDDFTAEFGHPVRFVYVNAYSGSLTIEPREFWPLVNGVAVWQTREELAGDRFIFFERPERE